MSDFSQMSYTQSPLVLYNTNSAYSGIYIEWERNNTTSTYLYRIYRSSVFDGTYEEIDTVLYPTNEYVDSSGTPSSYYKVAEEDEAGTVISLSAPINGDELLLKSSLRYELMDLLNIPIYDEEVVFHKDRSQASVAFPYWNYMPRPEIRITSYSNEGDRDSLQPLSEITPIYKTINATYDPIEYSRDGNVVQYTDGNNYPNGLKVKYDYLGNIYFIDANGNPVSIHSYDTVFVSYHVKAFTTDMMNSALYMALQMINSQPGASKYSSVSNVPFYYDPALIYGAVYFLLRSLLVNLTQRQKRLLLEDPDKSIISDIRETSKMYQEDFKELLKKLPTAVYPGIRGIVVPEFNMPGGRSRFFRYIWNIGTGS